jgi:hypothetical protein
VALIFRAILISDIVGMIYARDLTPLDIHLQQSPTAMQLCI